MTEPPTPTPTPSLAVPPGRAHPIVPNVIESLDLVRLASGRHVLRLYLPGHPEGVHHDFDYRPDDPSDNRAAMLLTASQHINAGIPLLPGRLPFLFIQAMRVWARWLSSHATLMDLHACLPVDVQAVRTWAEQLHRLVGLPDEGPTFKCPDCGAVSHNPHDLAHRFCGRCDRFVDDPRPEVH